MSTREHCSTAPGGQGRLSGVVDFNQLAHRVVQATIDRDEPAVEEPKTPAQVNGHKGGVKGGKARAQKLTAGERSEIASKAAKVRWRKRPAS
jgi:hypothetical protein